MSRVIVVSPATHPEPQHMAAALIQAGHEVVLATAASFAGDEPVMRLAEGLPLGAVSAEVLRRRLPAGITGRQVVRGAYTDELMHLYHRRLTKNLDKAWDACARRDRAFAAKVARLIAREDPDVIIAQAYQSAAGPAFAASPRSLRILSYPTAHHRWYAREMDREERENPDWAEHIQSADRPDAAFLDQLDEEMAAADVIVVGSSFVKRTCIEYGVEADRIVVVPLAAPDFTESTAYFNPFSIEAKLRVLFAGQVTQRKGVSYLVDAVESIERDGVELAFVGPISASLQSRLASIPGVHLSGPRPRAELMSAMAHADVVALPSLVEGFPLTAIESMSSGTAALVSTATFADDVVTDGVDGFIVPTRDSDAIRRALQRLADEPGLAQSMGERARERARDFTWPRYAERFRAAFATLPDRDGHWPSGADVRRHSRLRNLATPGVDIHIASGGVAALAQTAALATTARATSRIGHRGVRDATRVLSQIFPAGGKAIVSRPGGHRFEILLDDIYWTRLLDSSYAYEPEVAALLARYVNPHTYFLDCGANIGYWSILLRHQARAVVAVEASPSTRARLEANLALNDGAVTVVGDALWHTSGQTLTFHVSDRHHEASSVLNGGVTHVSDDEWRPVTVETITLDDLAATYCPDVEAAVVVKLDIEGAEVEALSGGQRLFAERAVYVIAEDHGSDPDHHVTAALLARGLTVHDPLTGESLDLDGVARRKTDPTRGYNFLALSPKARLESSTTGRG